MTDPMLNRHVLSLEESFERLRRLEKMVREGVPRHRGRKGRDELIALAFRKYGTSLPSPFGGWSNNGVKPVD